MDASTILPAKISTEEMLALLSASKTDNFVDRRTAVRHPFFCPIALQPTAVGEMPLSAFSREISVSGLGLLLVTPVKAGETFHATIRQGNVTIERLAQIIWCRAAGDGWYLCGCRFIEASL